LYYTLRNLPGTPVSGKELVDQDVQALLLILYRGVTQYNSWSHRSHYNRCPCTIRTRSYQNNSEADKRATVRRTIRGLD
jgi:hypothetical protein